MNLENNKYVNIVLSILAVSYVIWLINDYDALVYMDHMPSGRNAKKMILLQLFLDKTVGKTGTILILSILASPFIYRTFKYNILNKKNTIQKSQKKQKTMLSINDKFRYENYEIQVTEITSTKKGFSGKGYIEIGMVNRIKETVKFSNIELNQDFVSVKGNIIFLDKE